MLERLALAMALALSPERCAACDAFVSFRCVFCPPCAIAASACDAPWSPGGAAPSVGRIAAPFSYGGSVASAIARFKYGARPDLARPLSQLFLRVAPQLFVDARSAANDGYDLIVPVPLHPSRLAERGFNQAALLARPLARLLRTPWSPRALARGHATVPQAGLHRVGRQGNVSGAFGVRERRGLRGLRILLVDDVATTGQTLDACARAARAAGARAVDAAVLARVL